jgi:hypothetical protein
LAFSRVCERGGRPGLVDRDDDFVRTFQELLEPPSPSSDRS